VGKLVRDNIPQLMRDQGVLPKVRVLHDDKEFMLALREKLKEEVAEFSEVPSIEELVDVMEVVQALYNLVKQTGGDIDGARARKRARNGRFARRQYLE
jgi:predicted house-cleaning noncanonical NTP pyrophosphatase (MazG superfamily)